jgi:hypothetical protein
MKLDAVNRALPMRDALNDAVLARRGHDEVFGQRACVDA